jgi:hypothetical protein
LPARVSFIDAGGVNHKKEFSMKNLIKLLGVIALAAVIGFLFVGCEEEPKDELDGTTWEYIGTEGGVSETGTWVLKFNSPNVTLTASAQGQTVTMSGTYSVSGNTVTLTLTDEDGETDTGTGTISGNKLTIGEMTFTKK